MVKYLQAHLSDEDYKALVKKKRQSGAKNWAEFFKTCEVPNGKNNCVE